MANDGIYRLLFNKILGPIFTLLGLIGNSLCIIAIAYRNYGLKQGKQQFNGMKGYMYAYLTSLAFADICYLIFDGMNYYLTATEEIQEQGQYLRNFIIIPTTNAFKAISDFIVILMTVDRYRIMGDITEIRLQTLRKNTKEDRKHWTVFAQICGAVALSFALYAPGYFPDHHEKNTALEESEEKGSRFQDLELIFQVICIAITKVMPMVLIVGLNIVIIQRLRIVWRRRKRVTEVVTIEARRQNWAVACKKSIQEQKLATLLVVIACSFVILTLPANIAYIIFQLVIKEENATYNSSFPLFAITNFLESVNYSINFYIYCVVHDDIRQSFVDFCKHSFTCKRHDPNARQQEN